jgi:uncharacterized protein YyaL (SSP411 family)
MNRALPSLVARSVGLVPVRAVLLLSILCGASPLHSSPSSEDPVASAKADEAKSGEPEAPSPDAEGTKAPAETRRANRLAKEKSPYLLQHAHNPVDWFPWSPEAFEKSRIENKPIFLSIGYATCHWCHVMEHETFENEEIAAYLAEHFVAIKVDREERPDVDAIYMAVCQAMNEGSGGWPLSAFLTPSGEAFYAGTYYPPATFRSLLERVVELWKDEAQRSVLTDQAKRVTEFLRDQTAPTDPAGELSSANSDAAFAAFRSSFDDLYGGFGRAPKFPQASNLDFLLRFAARTGDARALELVTGTLDAIQRGGIRDHLGGGFHRYATDRVWLVPHFEKMLYDNAQLARVYADAALSTGNAEYLAVARETLDYLLRRMRDRGGAFHSAEDADTSGEEGLTYVWTRAEILAALGSENGPVFCDWYGVGEEGNFVEPRSTEPSIHSVLHIPDSASLAAFAAQRGKSAEAVVDILSAARAKLLEIRDRREQPFLDDKILTEWNGLVISAFSRVHQATGDGRYLDAARGAATFILEKMVRENRLYRRYRDGELAIPAFLEDHAFFVEGLLDLWETDFDRRWLDEALRWTRAALGLFADPAGGFYSSATDHEKLITRRKDLYDGAVPSGNSVMYANLLRLALITGDATLGTAARNIESAAAASVASSPTAHSQLLAGLEFRLSRPLEIVVVGPLDDGATGALLAEIRSRYLPAKVVLHARDGAAAEALVPVSPLFEARAPIEGRPTAWVCRDRVCKLPARDAATLAAQLDGARTPGGEAPRKE